MPLVRKKRSWKRHFLYLAALTVLSTSAVLTFHQRFRIAIDTQIDKCLPHKTFFLIDLKDKELRRDALYAFGSRGLQPFYEDGTQMVKILMGIQGDEVEIRDDAGLIAIHVNDKPVGTGVFHAERLSIKPENLLGRRVLDKDELWFMGISPTSFDSRYWGAATHEQIIGRAYAIF